MTVSLDSQIKHDDGREWGMNYPLTTVFLWSDPQTASVAKAEALAEWERLWPVSRRAHKNGKPFKVRVIVGLCGSPNSIFAASPLEWLSKTSRYSVPVVAMQRGVIGSAIRRGSP